MAIGYQLEEDPGLVGEEGDGDDGQCRNDEDLAVAFDGETMDEGICNGIGIRLTD